MKIGLWSDCHNFPSLPLMKLSAYHKKLGNTVEFVNYFEHYDLVYASKVFSFTEDIEDKVISTDLVYRGYGKKESLDFLTESTNCFNGDIITNPPYKYALEFVRRALEIIPPGRKTAMFLKLTFLEGQKRKDFFLHNPPKTVYVSSSRLICAMNGEFDKYPSSAVAYAWFVWEKGYMGEPVIKWIN